jgi:hypothetical protein
MLDPMPSPAYMRPFAFCERQSTRGGRAEGRARKGRTVDGKDEHRFEVAIATADLFEQLEKKGSFDWRARWSPAEVSFVGDSFVGERDGECSARARVVVFYPSALTAAEVEVAVATARRLAKDDLGSGGAASTADNPFVAHAAGNVSPGRYA